MSQITELLAASPFTLNTARAMTALRSHAPTGPASWLRATDVEAVIRALDQACAIDPPMFGWDLEILPTTDREFIVFVSNGSHGADMAGIPFLRLAGPALNARQVAGIDLEHLSHERWLVIAQQIIDTANDTVAAARQLTAPAA
jgi:hypothetical protein